MASSDDDQHHAVAAVERKARNVEPAASARLAAHGIDASSAERLAENVKANSRITLNFHPDRRDAQGRTVATGLLVDGRYRSQFETGISNGMRFAAPGGDRSHWESALFDGVYDDERLARPIYGALDLFGDPYGGAPRFGSCFVVLEPHCLDRVTLCVGDSHVGPTDVGSSRAMLSVIAGMVDQCATGDGFGRRLSTDGLLGSLAAGVAGAHRSARELDRYIEAQVHGTVELERDVLAIVLDPSFRRTAVERAIASAAERFGFAVEWNEGSEVAPEAIPPSFRGAEMLPLARRTARDDGLVDAAAIGRALAELRFTAPSVTGDPESSPQQRYKKLWHCCLAFGRPSSADPHPGGTDGDRRD